jgi:hypothetical protein
MTGKTAAIRVPSSDKITSGREGLHSLFHKSKRFFVAGKRCKCFCGRALPLRIEIAEKLGMREFLPICQNFSPDGDFFSAA